MESPVAPGSHSPAARSAKAWSTGRVRGLRVRGGYEVDMEWNDGALTQAVLRSLSNEAKPWVIRYGNKTKAFNIPAGGKTTLTPGTFE